MVFAIDVKDPFERIQIFWEQWKHDLTFHDGALIPHITPHSATLHSATKCTVTFLFTVPQSLCNRARNLHGGAAAAALDIATSISLAPIARGATAEKPSFWQWAGVSRTLNCTYLKAVPEGSTVAIVCDIVGVGARLCTTRGEIRDWDPERQRVGDQVFVLCEHGKVSVDPPLAEPAKL